MERCVKKRNHIYQIKDLDTGDRFYKAGDKSKTVFVLLLSEKKQTQYRTYEYFAVRSRIIDNPFLGKNTDYIYKNKVAIMGNTQVIYLRS